MKESVTNAYLLNTNQVAWKTRQKSAGKCKVQHRKRSIWGRTHRIACFLPRSCRQPCRTAQAPAQAFSAFSLEKGGKRRIRALSLGQQTIRFSPLQEWLWLKKWNFTQVEEEWQHPAVVSRTQTMPYLCLNISCQPSPSHNKAHQEDTPN